MGRYAYHVSRYARLSQLLIMTLPLYTTESARELITLALADNASMPAVVSKLRDTYNFPPKLAHLLSKHIIQDLADAGNAHAVAMVDRDAVLK